MDHLDIFSFLLVLVPRSALSGACYADESAGKCQENPDQKSGAPTNPVGKDGNAIGGSRTSDVGTGV